MARIDPVPQERLTLGTRLGFWMLRRMFGRVLRPYTVLAHAPRLVGANLLMTMLFGAGKWRIEPQLRTMIHLRVATLIGCVF